jgi:glycosyltransferase involved in cell wall biosynthesis
MLSSANCVVVSMTNQRVFHSVLPRKMFEAMACARPIVIAANGEAKEIVRSAGAGMCVTPERPEEIYDAILYLCKNRAEAAAMGERGRKLIREHFTTEHRARQLDERLQVLGA